LLTLTQGGYPGLVYVAPSGHKTRMKIAAARIGTLKAEGMKPTSKIYVAGHRGLVGSALVRRLEAAGYANLLTRTHAELDLERQDQVDAFFAKERPDYVFLAAAKVGGIHANSTYPVDFLLRNLKIQNNVIEACWRHKVEGLLFLGSSCIYPGLAPQPLKEEYLLSSPLEPTNEPYAIAKIAGIELCEAFNRQYSTRFLSTMPTNLYGPNDNYDLENSHVLPALIRKFHLAKLALQGDWTAIKSDEERFGPIPSDVRSNLTAISPSPLSYSSFGSYSSTHPSSSNPSASITLWGTGSPRREFLYSDDLADACIFLMQQIDDIFSSRSPLLPVPSRSSAVAHLINIGYGSDLTIRELAEMVAGTGGFDGKPDWDSTKPDGTPKKLLDVSRLSALGWKPQVSLKSGIRMAYEDYLDRR